MSYAVIIQSAPSAGAIRQTAVVPWKGTVSVYTRWAGKRGVAGAWNEQEPVILPGEQLVGTPVSISITENDERDLATSFPSTLFQKLVRRVSGVTGINPDHATLESVLAQVKLEAQDNPESLVKYFDNGVIGAPPLVEVVRQAPAPRAVEYIEPLDESPVDPANIPAGFWATLSVPTLEQVSSYIERKLPGNKLETEVFDFARARSEAVAIFGHAGTGKTSSAEHYAGIRGLPFVAFECNPQVDEEVVQGTFIPSGRGNELVWRYSALATALTQPSVVLLNESNRMSAKANALFLRILQERKLQVSRHNNEVLDVHPECLIITDANPGYRGTVSSDQAFLDRFAITLEYKYDRAIEEKFIPSSSLLDLACAMREQAEREDRWSTPISTRLLKNFCAQAQGLGLEFAVESFVMAFPVEERDALKMLFETYSFNIAQELGVTA